MIFVGNDWAEAHHDVWVMDEDGDRLAYRRLSEGIEGVSGFHELVGGFVSDPADVVVGIETDRGLWVHALVAAGYQVPDCHLLHIVEPRCSRAPSLPGTFYHAMCDCVF